MTLPTHLGLIEAGLATLSDTDARKILAGDASMALHHLRTLPLACWQRCREIELARPAPRIKLSRLLDAHILHMSLPSSTQPPASSPQHGGPRQPGPGKKIGRPAKAAKEKAICTTITLSSAKVLKTLQSRAKKAKLKPGAYIERELNLRDA